MVRSRAAICLSVCILAGTARAADGPYDSLIKYVPGHANVVALIDLKGAFASPLAKKENWIEKGHANNRGGLGFLPTESDTVVIASDVNFNSMTRYYQVALVKMRYNIPSLEVLANREGGTRDEIAGRLAVFSPRDVYYTSLSVNELAAIYPADRQESARWIRTAMTAKTTSVSPYIKGAVAKASGATVTIALDLEDVVDRTILKLSLPASPTVVRNKNLDLTMLSKVMASVKGMTFQAKVDNIITASMTWEFGLDPTAFQKTLPNMVLELIDGQGISIPNLDTWDVKFTPTTMTFTGTMTSMDLKNVVSLFAFPPLEEDLAEKDPKDKEPSDVPPKKGPEFSPQATRRYFAAVKSILDDLKKTMADPYYGKTATWHEKGAAQIAQLSRQRVDPAAVNAALDAARGLQSIGASLRGVPMDVSMLANQQYLVTYRQYGVMPGGWWGWRPYLGIGATTSVDTNIPQVQAAIAKVIDDDQNRRMDTWTEITRTMLETGRMLSDKYKLKF